MKQHRIKMIAEYLSRGLLAALAPAVAALAQEPAPGPMPALHCSMGRAVVSTLAREAGDPVLAVVDVGDAPEAVAGAQWANAPVFHHPHWTRARLGNIFGLALDDAVPPNVYAAATSSYLAKNDFGAVGAPGAIYKISGVSGEIEGGGPWAVLPNTGPALGNLAFEEVSRQLFASNFEDGKIYRLDLTGEVLDAYDPFAADDGIAGFAPLGERVWAVQAFEGRLYFSVWSVDARRRSGSDIDRARNAVHSVALGFGGGLDPASRRLEIEVPYFEGDATGGYSMPVADISFSGSGTMILAERGMVGNSLPRPHAARVLEYRRNGDGEWRPTERDFLVGRGASQRNAAGGVAHTRDGGLWVSGDALSRPKSWISGLASLEAGDPARPRLESGLHVDLDLLPSSDAGDVEIALCGPLCRGNLGFDFDLTNFRATFRATGEGPAGTSPLFWDFGDGTSATGLESQHLYRAAGTYTVTLARDVPASFGWVFLNLNVGFDDSATCTEIATNVLTFVGADSCCDSSFALVPEKTYVLGAWVKEDVFGTVAYANPSIALSFEVGAVFTDPDDFRFLPAGGIIDGWQRIEERFEVPAGATELRIDLDNAGPNEVFFDDIRIFPVDGNMKSFVYDPLSLRLMAELDERHYATLYEYDEEGGLIRVKKETERGLMTIQQSRSSTRKTVP